MTVKIRGWSRSCVLGGDLRTAEYGDYKFILQKRRGACFSGRRWRLEIFFRGNLCVCTGLPNLMVAKGKAQEWFDKNYNRRGREAATPAPAALHPMLEDTLHAGD